VPERNYGKAFEDGLVVEDGSIAESKILGGRTRVARQVTLHLHGIGQLLVTSGRIVACDPLTMPETPPFADMVEPGRYPVILSVAELPNADQRVAYALLKMSEHPAVRWEIAVPYGQTLGPLKSRETFGYGVDAGVGGFVDVDAARFLLAEGGETIAENDDSGDLFDRALSMLDQTRTTTWSWADLIADEATGANVIMFSSGWGDGFYSSYWGYDASNQQVALVTDFNVLDPSWLAH
jgi:hypothetical protein